MRFAIWRTAASAKALGATNHARFMGLVPGFYSKREALWVPRSDFLCWLEHLVAFLWVNLRLLRGEEPDFMVEVGREIDIECRARDALFHEREHP